MAVNQGLTLLAESTPNFSNQSVQNTINDLKIGWVVKSIELDTAIQNNTVLTVSQKTDLKEAINNKAYLNVGGYLGDMLRHVNTILNGTIIPLPADELETVNPVYATFLEILEQVQNVQNLVPEFYGVPASAKRRAVNDHLGIMNGSLSFVGIKESIQFITNAGLAADTAYQNATQNILDFLATLGDSSAFDESTFNSLQSSFQTAADNFDTALQSAPYDAKRTQIITDRNTIKSQIALEYANLTNIRDYTESLTSNTSYVSLASDPDLKNILIRTSQNSDWKSYFENYNTRQQHDNPIYNNSQSDSSNEEIITAVLRMKGLPDVTDYVDVASVANKALKDTRLIGKLSDSGKTIEKIIEDACVLLSIDIQNKDIYNRSKSLLSNMNENDREIVKTELDLHNQVNTLS